MMTIRSLLMGCCLACLSGCVMISWEPTGDYPAEGLNDFTATTSVTLVNGHPSTEQVNFNKRYTNYNLWTDVAIKIAKRELEKKGMTVAADTPRKLILSIESASTKSGWVMINSQVVMRAETSDGYVNTYTGADRSGMMGRPLAQMDKATTEAVVSMLNDPKIIEFLTK